MITPGAKLWYALCGLAFAAAAIYFVTSGGEKYGTFVLAFAAIAGAVLGTSAVALRDGDVAAPDPGQAVAEAPRVEALPAVWPALGALGVAVTIVGLAVGSILSWVGVAILAVTLVEWMVQAWAERSTPDPRANLGLRNRIMYPVEIPALAVIGVGLVVLTVSRMFLALPKMGAVVFASVIAVVILAVASLLANRPRVSSSVLSGALALGAVLLIAGGIVGGVVGEREFEHHGDEEAHASEAEGEGDDEAEGDDEDTEEPGAEVTPRAPRPEGARGESDADVSAEETPEEQLDDVEVDQTPGDSESVGDPIRTSPDETTAVSTP